MQSRRTSTCKAGLSVQTARNSGGFLKSGGESFKVSAPMVSDYWLKKEYVAEAKEGSISLRLTKEELLTVKQDSPDERAKLEGEE